MSWNIKQAIKERERKQKERASRKEKERESKGSSTEEEMRFLHNFIQPCFPFSSPVQIYHTACGPGVNQAVRQCSEFELDSTSSFRKGI